MQENKIPQIKIVRNQKTEDGVIKDDYLQITYLPDETQKYDYETMLIATKNLKGFIQALSAKADEITLKDF